MSSLLMFLETNGLELVLALSILLAAGALVVRCSRSALRRHRHAELTFVVALFATILLVVPLPRIKFSSAEPAALPLSSPPQPVVRVTEESSALNQAPASSLLELQPTHQAVIDAAPDSSGLVTWFSETLEANATLPAIESVPVPIARWIAIVFSIGALGLGSHLIVSLCLLMRLVKRANEAPAEVRTLAAELGPARVLVTDEIKRPFCFGLGAGVILLPTDLLETQEGGRHSEPYFNERRVRAVLLHEQAHLAHGHGRARLVAALVTPLLFWHPLFWWLVRSARQDAELIADHLATQSMDKHNYAKELLSLIETTGQARLSRSLGLGVFGSRHQFLNRMETLLMRPKPFITRESGLQVAGRASLAVAALASVTLAWGRTPQPSQSQDDKSTASSSTPNSQLPGGLLPSRNTIPGELPVLAQLFEEHAQDFTATNSNSDLTAQQAGEKDPLSVSSEISALSRLFQGENGQLPGAASAGASPSNPQPSGLTAPSLPPAGFSPFGASSRQPEQSAALSAFMSPTTGLSTPEVELRFEFSRLEKVQELQKLVKSMGGRFAIVDIQWSGTGSKTIAGRGILTGLARNQMEQLDQFLSVKKATGTESEYYKRTTADLLAIREQMQSLAEKLDHLQVEQATLEQALQQERSRTADSTINRLLFLPPAEQSSSKVADPAIRGEILAIDKNSGASLILINRGKQHGAQGGTTFEVYSNSKYKGRIKVSDAHDFYSIATVVQSHNTFNAGDSVSTKL